MYGPKVPQDLIEPIKCEKCQAEIFELFHKMGKVSALRSPNGKELFTSSPIYRCTACGTFLELKESKEEEEEKQPSAIVTK